MADLLSLLGAESVIAACQPVFQRLVVLDPAGVSDHAFGNVIAGDSRGALPH